MLLRSTLLVIAVLALAACTELGGRSEETPNRHATPADSLPQEPSSLSEDAPEATPLPGVALLLEGPIPGWGIDEFAPDLTAFWSGVYAVEAARIEIRLTESPLDETASWSVEPCPLPLRVEEPLYYHENASGWALLFRVTGELPNGVTPCSYTTSFASAYRLFANLERSEGRRPPAFPAVLEF